MLNPETRDFFASIGIEKGKSFAPDERMKRILTDAIGNATARTIVKQLVSNHSREKLVYNSRNVWSIGAMT
jgi:hypothetical protein